MSKISLYVFFAAVALLVLAVVFEMPMAAGGSGVVLMVGLIYAYVVAKRDEERGEPAQVSAEETAEPAE